MKLKSLFLYSQSLNIECDLSLYYIFTIDLKKLLWFYYVFSFVFAMFCVKLLISFWYVRGNE